MGIEGNHSLLVAPYYTEDGWTERHSAIPYFLGTVAFATIVYIFETYLDYRQYEKLKDPNFPAPLIPVLSGLGTYSKKKKKDSEQETEKTEEQEEEQEEKSLLDATKDKFQASRAYGLDKSKFGFISGFYTQMESMVLLFLGYLPFMWHLSALGLEMLGLDAQNEIYRSLMLVTLTTLRDTMIGLPFSLYSTFVIEARHGFNNQTLSIFLMDKVKGFLLMIVIGYPVLSILIVLIQWGGEYFYWYVWAFLFAFSILMMTIVPIWIMPLFNTFTPLEEGELRTKIETLAAKLSFPLTKLFVCDGSKRSNHSNAYFYGLFNSKRIVIFDTLLEQATDDEILAILGHELGHWQLWHVAQNFVIQQLLTFVSFYVFGLCMNDKELFAAFGFATETIDKAPVIIAFILFSQTIWAPIDHTLSFLMTLNTRKNEFQADAFAVDLGYVQPLKTGVAKLSIDNLSNLNPDPLYSAYHYSHPPLLERLTAMIKRGDEQAKKDK